MCQWSLKVCVSVLLKCSSVLLSWCIHEHGEQCRNRVAAHIIARLLITENSVCIQDNFEGQWLLSVRMNHHRTGEIRRRLRTEWALVALVSPWHFIEHYYHSYTLRWYLTSDYLSAFLGGVPVFLWHQGLVCDLGSNYCKPMCV